MAVSLGSIEALIKMACSKALHGQVKDQFLVDITNNATSMVYGAYSPYIYERRFTLNNAGTYNVENMGELQIGITPEAEFNRAYGGYNYGNELAGLMNYGAGWGGYFFDYGTPNPRPFIEPTVDQWQGKYVNIMRSALQAAGLTVK